MTIVALEHVTLAGLSREKSQMLDELHRRGWLQLIPAGSVTPPESGAGPSPAATEALKFLLACPARRRQTTADAHFDPAQVEQQALELQKRIALLETERDDLRERLTAAEPWGDFRFPKLHELAGNRLWFYVVPDRQMPQLVGSELRWQSLRRDAGTNYVVVIDPDEPTGLSVPRVHIGSRSPGELRERIAQVEQALEAAQAERSGLTQWCLLLAQNITRLENRAARIAAESWTCDRDPVFAVQAWVPREHVGELAEYAAQQGFVFERRPPRPEENPPTLMQNSSAVSAGEDLVNFYMTPGYWTWDPSPVVFFSFAIFFAMILADAGYAAVLGIGLLCAWRPMGRSAGGLRMRPLLAWIVGFSLIFGVLVGSYFGVTPSPDSLPGRLHVLDMNNSGMMMGLSVLVGALHVILANVLDARRRTDWREALGPLGWAAAIAGGLIFGVGAVFPTMALLKSVGVVAAVAGLLMVVLFTAPHERAGSRLLQGMLGLTKVSAAFGDILSYLRLFALGLASASLAVAFNDMAAGIRSSMPRFGLLLALLILAFGHVLNLLLGISSGVIHGLRLNVIEFFNWGLKEEGRRFTPFRRKEGSTWK